MAKYNDLTPFNKKIWNSIWRWQDNVVAEFREKNANEIENIVKWNHDSKWKETIKWNFDWVLYKKKKYELLKLFLWDFIPNSYFVLWNKNDNNKIKIKEFTLQERVPRKTIKSLSKELKNNTILLHNIQLLIQKLQIMYKYINLINSSVEIWWKLDWKLDLWWLSKYAEDSIKNTDNISDIVNYNFFKTPNLLVNPDTLQLFCIDFDQWIWSDEKEASFILLKNMIENNSEIKRILTKKQKIVS